MRVADEACEADEGTPRAYDTRVETKEGLRATKDDVCRIVNGSTSPDTFFRSLGRSDSLIPDGTTAAETIFHGPSARDVR